MEIRPFQIAASLAISSCLVFAPVQSPAQGAKPNAPASLESLQFKFNVAREEVNKPLLELNTKYEASLKTLQEKVRKAGKLDQTLAVQNELEGYAAGTTKPVENFEELNRIRNIYANQSRRLNEVRADKLTRLLESYQKQLDQLEIDLTKANKLKGAIDTREESKRVAERLKGLEKGGGASAKEPATAAGETGRLHAFGKFSQGQAIPLESAARFDDLVAVRLKGSGGWVALRTNGKVVADSFSEVAEFGSKIGKLGSGNHDAALFGIDTRGQIEIVHARDSVDPESNARKRLRDVVDIYCGGRKGQVLALAADSTVAAWGDAYDQPGAKPPPAEALTAVKAISSWGDKCFAVKSDGSVICWIAGSDPIPVPDEIKNVATVSAGGYFDLALTESGEVLAWGNNTHGECNIPKDLGKCNAVRASLFTAAARKEDGSWVAWGDNTEGIVDKINTLGPVTDLAFMAASNAQPPYGFLLWIEGE